MQLKISINGDYSPDLNWTLKSPKRELNFSPVPWNIILYSTKFYYEGMLFSHKYEDKMKTEINLARSK